MILSTSFHTASPNKYDFSIQETKVTTIVCLASCVSLVKCLDLSELQFSDL